MPKLDKSHELECLVGPFGIVFDQPPVYDALYVSETTKQMGIGQLSAESAVEQFHLGLCKRVLIRALDLPG